MKKCDELDRFGGNHTIHEQDQKDSRFGMLCDLGSHCSIPSILNNGPDQRRAGNNNLIKLVNYVHSMSFIYFNHFKYIIINSSSP